ncbi:type II secretion system F family protein [Sulfobacillus thermosulfidooxidans]|uniref:type II secretion system F family protein n=1 Tax=Sulfobacillus thermosulfidooxidans TaxID=28034 RepID=UPI0002E6FFCD|nr:hypothetical protein [Sulfobacillus thermosulfidooxidans]
MGWIVLTALVTAGGVWGLLSPKPAHYAFGTRAEPSPARPRRTLPPAERMKGTVRLIWLSGIPLPAPLLKPLSVITAVGVGLLGFVATRNIPVAIILSLMAFRIPETLLRNLGLARWREADAEAYVLTNTLQFLLPVFGHPLVALREVAHGLHGPLQQWMGEVLATETTGGNAEHALFDLGVRLGHPEIQLLAEILKADRREKPSADLLAELIQAWTERIRQDKKRQAKLAATKRFTTLIVAGPVIGFVALGLLSPGVMAVFHDTLAGQMAGALGMAMMGSAALIARNSLRRAEEVPF